MLMAYVADELFHVVWYSNAWVKDFMIIPEFRVIKY